MLPGKQLLMFVNYLLNKETKSFKLAENQEAYPTVKK